MATLLASERNANVVTSTPKCHVLRFSGGQFKKMLKNLPYFSVGLVQSLAQRLQRTSESKTQTEHVGAGDTCGNVTIAARTLLYAASRSAALHEWFRA